MTGENDPVEDLTEPSTPSVAVVTGASSGIGLAAAEELARRGWAVTLVGRDPTRLAQAVRQVEAVAKHPVTGHHCDYASFAEVRELAAALKAAHPHIDVLANNAGGMVHQRERTVDGFEATIQTNHLASFLLSLLLRDNLRGGRIVNTASAAHRQGRLDPADLNGENLPYRALFRYGTGKLANILFAAEAARRWPEIQSTSFHPGVVRTRFGAGGKLYEIYYKVMPGLRTPAKGAETLVWLSTVDSKTVKDGAYYMDCHEAGVSQRASDASVATRLWDASLAAVGEA
jgi:daunorubicin C-13 ketoreductase